jgi:acyl-CoA thioesterase
MIKAFGNAYGNVKRAWSYQDNLTRVIGRHSLKAGFFWDSNVQIATTGWAGNFTQGGIEFDNWSNYTTGNPVADILTGHTDGMQITTSGRSMRKTSGTLRARLPLTLDSASIMKVNGIRLMATD